MAKRPLERRWRCAVCSVNEIIESKMETPFEGEVPDQNNCDLSTYGPVTVSGGWLFADNPEPIWMPASVFPPRGPEGGICDHCLKKMPVVKLVSHIRFAKIS